MFDQIAQLQLENSGWEASSLGAERFQVNSRTIKRFVSRRAGGESVSEVPLLVPAAEDFSAAFDASWLRMEQKPTLVGIGTGTLRVADLFSGCGGLSLGVQEAARALGMGVEFAFASDIYPAALDVYRANLKPERVSSEPLETVVNGRIGARRTNAERQLIEELGRIDFLLAGPPCQGHSDLNNHTRREDPKNQLVVRVARFVELFEPRFVLIENVQGIRHDKLDSLAAVRAVLHRRGYSVSEAVLRADFVGAAQSRKRFVLIAGRDGVQDLHHLAASPSVAQRPLSWAIDDLIDSDVNEVFDGPATHSAENQRRIRYLLAKDIYELPNALRPPCHRDKPHTYTGVYGRMYWERPAPTITTGFGSTGQGRFVHPLRPRTLTPHEAARVQFFPDFFDFGVRGRREYQKLIGNAVPSKLAYAVALHQLR